MFSVQFNLPSLTAWRNLKNTGAEQQRAASRLSSGFRVNSAADDAAGLAISENMRAQIRGLDRAYKNTRDGHALLTTMDGGLDTIGAMLHRKRELTIQALNDTYTTDQRRMIQLEVTQLIHEIDSFANRLEFNGETLLNRRSALQDSLRMPDVHGGIQPGITFGNIPGTVISASVVNPGTNPYLYTGNLVFTQQPGGSTSNFATLSLPQGFRIIMAGSLGAGGQQISLVSPNGTIIGMHSGSIVTTGGMVDTTYGQVHLNPNNGNLTIENMTVLGAGEWTVMVDIPPDTSAITVVFHVIVDPGDGFVPVEPPAHFIFPDIWLQVGANSMQGINIPTFDARAAALGVDGLNVVNHHSANNALRAIDNALDQVNGFRAIIGANMNRLDHTAKSLLISNENLQDAESRIRNADIAREMMQFTMANVLQQAGVSMLAQANRGKDVFLQLLR